MTAEYDLIFRRVTVLDGTGEDRYLADVAVKENKIADIGDLGVLSALREIDGRGLCLAPGFIDVHTHDDTNVIRFPDMLPKISQGVTTVIVGNCGISASPVTLRAEPPNPMNLLGEREDFIYPTFKDYAEAVSQAKPAVNVAALVGHTALRANHMDSYDRAATIAEIDGMCSQLAMAMKQGAIGLSTGLAYSSAFAAPTSEILALADVLRQTGGIYATHLRSEFAEIVEAMNEAFEIAGHGRVPVVLSHHKCAGKENWGRTKETLALIDKVGVRQPVALDCYPYTASSSNLDLKQVTADFDILVTWSTPHPEQAGKTLKEVAQQWQLSLIDTAEKLQPAGAVYHCMDDSDVCRVLKHEKTMIGSDGLPNDPLPHPRLWGTFPRVLGLYSRERKLFSLETAVHKMTGLSAARFNLPERGEIKVGKVADLVLFNPDTVIDKADYHVPVQMADGVEIVVVNGQVSFESGKVSSTRHGRMLLRQDAE